MTYRLFLDDEREPIGKWLIARSFKEACAFVEALGFPSFVSFDHDLGSYKTGYDFAKWLVDYDLDFDNMPTDFKFVVHSQNPIGKENIESYLDNYLRLKQFWNSTIH